MSERSIAQAPVKVATPAQPVALQRACACGQHTYGGGECEECKKKGLLQRKLAIGAINDPLEQEADHIANEVLAAPAHAPVSGAPLSIRRLAGPASGPAGTAPSSVDRALNEPGVLLSPALEAEMGQRFGHDFSRVRVHTGPAAERSARDVNALAYTVGHDIVFGAGGFAPQAPEGRRLLAHELTHVIQQTSPSNVTMQIASPQAELQALRATGQSMRLGMTMSGLGYSGQRLARAPIEPVKTAEAAKKEHQVDLQHLRDLLVKLMQSLSPKEQARIDRNSTVVLALVEVTDERNEVFTTLVYTAAGNRNTVELENAAARLDIANIGAVPRADGRGEAGAPADAEQLLSEATTANDMKILGQAVVRRPCLDCAEMIKDEDIKTTWLGAAEKKAAFGAGRVHRRGSASLKRAVDEVELAFMPAAAEPGKVSEVGLGPDSPVWAALNGLDIKELYTVLELQQQKGRLNAMQEAAYKAHGIYKERLVAVMVTLGYKRQLQSASPSDSVLLGAYDLLLAAIRDLPEDQQKYLQSVLRPAMRSLVKRAAVPTPKKEPTKAQEKRNQATPKESTETGLEKAVKAGLKAAGVVLTTLVLAELVEAIASAIFVEVIIASTAEALKGTAKGKVKEIVTREVKKRVAVSPQQAEKAIEYVYHELETHVPKVMQMGK